MADLTKQDFVAHLLLRGFKPSLAPDDIYHIQVDTPMGIAASEYVSVAIEETHHKMEIKIIDSSGIIFEQDFTHALETIDTRLRVAQTYVNLKEECYATPNNE